MSGGHFAFHGKAGEYLFASDAAANNLVIGFPSIESIPFDLFVFNGVNTFRVQIKTVDPSRTGPGKLRAYIRKRGNAAYTVDDCDFVVIVLPGSHDYYIIPIHEVAGKTSVTLNADNKLAQYKNAWHLLEGVKKDVRQ
jgi:hypothetical protein